MTVVEDSSPAPDQLEDLLDEQVGERTALAEDVHKQVCIYLKYFLPSGCDL
jgi:hypothetical protein